MVEDKKKVSKYIATGTYKVVIDGAVYRFGGAGEKVTISDENTINVLLGANVITKK